MDSLIFSLNATIPIFMVMVLGYLLKYTSLMPPQFVSYLNKFNFQVTLPVLVVMNLSTADFYEVWSTKYFLFCFFVTLFCILITWAFAKLAWRKKGTKEQKEIGEFVQGAYRGSAAVLGIAFIENIYGSSKIGPLMILGTVPLYNIMSVLILSLTASRCSKPDKKLLQKSVMEIFTNPIIISIVLGLVLSLLRVQYPPILEKPLQMIANIASPLALIGLGGGFEGRKAIAKIKPTLVATFTKLFLWPAIFLPLAAYLGFRGEYIVALIIMLGSPTTASCYIMARNMKHEGTLTSSIVVCTTFLSSVSLTLWLFLLRYFRLC